MGCENEPTLSALILINKAFDNFGIVSALLQKESGKVIKVDIPDVECLTTTPAASKVLRYPLFRLWSRDADRIGKRVEGCLRGKFGELFSIPNDFTFEHVRWSVPGMTVAEGVASQLMPLCKQHRQIFWRKDASGRRLASHQAKRCIISSCRPVGLQNGAPGQ